jgi:hypothetical protein
MIRFAKEKIQAFFRFIWKNFLYQVVFRSTEQEGEYFRNQFGSIISPLEFKISWDSNLTERAAMLKVLITPKYEIGKSEKLIRLGSVGDGGYFLPSTYRNCDGAISGGIAKNNDFENDLACMNIPVIQFDHTIDEAPIKHKNLYFQKIKLGHEGFSLSQTLSAFKELTGIELKKGILKLDIEGSEFDFFANTDVETLSNFDVIIMELHFLGNIYQDLFWEKVKNSLSLIRQNHKPIIVIGNNSRPYIQIGGIPICDIVEITFIRNDENYPIFDKNMSMAVHIEGRAPLIIT